MVLLMRKRLILAATETTYNVDPTPTGANAILVRDLNITPQQSDVVDRNLIRPYLGASEQLLANTRVEVTFSVELAGSGTPGTAPRHAPVLKACGMAETTVATDVTGTATAGAKNSITLGASASAVDDFYNGEIIRITAGTGNGGLATISKYVGATKVATLEPFTGDITCDNTSAYKIGKCVYYTPVSSNFSSCTIYYNMDGVLHRLTGCRGTYTINTQVGQIPTLDFTITGIYNPPTDTPAPQVTFGDQAPPKIFKAGNTGGYDLLGYSGCLMSIQLQVNNQIIYRELVNCTKQVLITDRRPTGTTMVEAMTVADKDYWTIALTDGLVGNLSFMHGYEDGNIVSYSSTRVDIGDVSYQDSDGIAMMQLPFVAIPTTKGNDEFKLVFS